MDFDRIQRHYDQGDPEGVADALMSGFAKKYGTSHGHRGFHILGEGPFPAVGTNIKTNVNHVAGLNTRGAAMTSYVPDESGNLHLLEMGTTAGGELPDFADWRINTGPDKGLASLGLGLEDEPHPSGLWTPQGRSIADFVTHYGKHPAPSENWRRANAAIMRSRALHNRGPGNTHVTVFDNNPGGRGMSFLVDPSGRYAGEPDPERGR